jgi:general secretion pathway protein E
VRTLCKLCKAPDVGDDEIAGTADSHAARAQGLLAEVVKPWKLNGNSRPYRPVGCVDCRMTGYMGRMGLYELLTVTEDFKDKVTLTPNADTLRRQAVQDGMRPLRLAGALRVAEGMTTLDEILSATPPLQP